MANLIASDIFDPMVNAVVTSKTDYLDRADLFLVDFALELGVKSTDIKISPLPFKTKLLLVYWVCWQVCRDNIGKNVVSLSNGTNIDYYEKKAKEYKADLADQKTLCTAAVISGTITEEYDKSRSVTEYGRA